MHEPNWNHTKIIDHRRLDAAAVLNYGALSPDADTISVISKDAEEMKAVIDHLIASRKFHVCGGWVEFGTHIVDLTHTDIRTSPEMEARIRGCLQKWRDDREGR